MKEGAAGDQRTLGFWSATALIVASMIGTGVFTTSGFALADLGSRWAVVAAWLVGGLIAALGATCYGALARRLPESGGEYLFLSRTMHPAAGYLAGWISLLVGFSAPAAAAAHAFGSYAQPWAGGMDPRVTGTAVLVAFSLAHAWQVRAGAGFQNAIVALKLVLIGGFAVFGLGRVEWAEAAGGAAPSIGAFGVSLVWISFSYSGWNAAVYLGSEVKDGERTLPRSMLAATVFVTVAYVALNAVFVFSAPRETLAGQLEVGRLAAQAIGGATAANLLTVMVLLALSTSVSSMIMAGPRVYALMAKDGYLPGWFRSGVGPPRSSIVLQLGLSLALMWTLTFKGLMTYIGFTLGLSTAATVVGLIRLRLREGAAVAVPGWPWVPIVFVAFVLYGAVFAVLRQPFESGLGLATLGIGLAAWWAQRKGGR